MLLALAGVAVVSVAVANASLARLASGRLQPLRRVSTSRAEVALTFDISWGETMPTKVADILKAVEAKVTVFISGPWASKHPEVVKRLAADGHELASHGYTHKNMSAWGHDQISSAISLTHGIIKNLTGQTARFIRPPNGDYDDLVIETAAELGYTVVIWSLDSLDWLNPGVDKIVDRVLSRVQAGDIILMHASDTCKQTDLALPAVLAGLEQRGIGIVTLRELVAGSARFE
jgi:polysaccharide deacetylase family sporulation protein PdaB